MNTNLLNIIKKIVSERGENILADPQQMRPLFTDYAKDEPKEQRIAFGRCIEIGSYNELKKTRTPQERVRVKASLGDLLHAKTGIDKGQCAAALDLLEAVMFSAQPSTASTPPGQPAGSAQSISNKTLVFGIAGAIGAGAASLFAEVLPLDGDGGTVINVILITATLSAIIALGISIGLLVAQNIYLKKKPVFKTIIFTALIGMLIGALAGAVAQIVFSLTTETSPAARETIRAMCWGIMGLGVGWGVSRFVPNYPIKRAILAGFLGGTIGGALFIATGSLLYTSGSISRLIGFTTLGLFIGLTISIIEEALREAWLTVIWGKNETKNISLGQKPVIFGSASEADIYLSKEPPVRASVQTENAKVVMYDKKTGQRFELQNGSKVDFEKVSFVVNIKKK